MHFVPWKSIRSWRCTTCGICCRHYDVVLKFPEWLHIVKTFGVNYTSSSLNKLFLGRRGNGSCAFLHETQNGSFCGLQFIKPRACRIWPFKVLTRPRFGSPSQAIYTYKDRRFFIYADSVCRGLRFGIPTRELVYSIIPEFIGIAIGSNRKQFKTTAFF